MSSDTLYNRFFDQRLRESPYASHQEHLAEQMGLVDLLCWAFSEENHNEDTPYSTRGVTVTEAQFYSALSVGGGAGLPEAREAAAHIEARQRVSAAQGVPLPFCALCTRFQLNAFEAFCLFLGCCVDLNRKYETIFGFLQNDVNCGRATLGLAADLFRFLSPVDSNILYGMLDRGHLLNRVLLADWEDLPGRSALARPLAVQKRVLYELCGVERAVSDELSNFCRVILPTFEPVLLHEQMLSDCGRLIAYYDLLGDETKSALIYLRGGAGMGKSFGLSVVARQASKVFYEVDMRYLLPLPANAQDALLRTLTVQCLLDGVIPCLDHAEPDLPGMRELVVRAVRWLERDFKLLLLCGSSPWDMERYFDGPHHSLELPPPTEDERRQLWTHFLKQEACVLSGVDPFELASRYRISPKQIHALAIELRDNARVMEASPSTLRQVSQALRETAQNRLGSIAKLINTPFTWEDLQLPDESRRLLQKAADRVKYRYQVNTTWGFHRKLPYGGGLSILLFGPPGTGKTMTAQVFANEIQMDVFRIDLSQIVDKYIGETEKKLSQLFETAENVNCVLFFDEADALFSKRTEVSDSKDKYANSETSYLLQRIEQYSGISILATNNLRNFDEAFRRRVTYFVNVPMPEAETRERIWNTVFPRELPLDWTVSFPDLAKQFELSGSSIKSIAVAAAYEAATTGTAVTRECLLEAVKTENAKNGRIMTELDYL